MARRFCACFLQAAMVTAAITAIAYGGGAIAAEPDSQLCLSCHNEQSWPGVQEIFQSPHASLPRGTGDIPVCVSCHGEAAGHLGDPGENPPRITFAPGSDTAMEIGNQVCLECHQSESLAQWSGGIHETEDVPCSGCHTIHESRPTITDRTEQASACYACHQEVRARVNLPSRHPLREAQMICSDCHNPHGSTTPADLKATSLNETCYQCHAEFRGPYLFDHPPATEDCATCHQPHGSVHEPLLVSRGPYLCQQCHSAAFHPSDLVSGEGLPGRGRNRNLLSRNCLNCHPKIHGSNHPSGARLTR